MFRKFMTLAAALAAASPADAAGVLAFPTAEGLGRHAIGGRGGEVYIVDSLFDSGLGSLRECAEASGPRTCVVIVDGDIHLDRSIRITSPYLTIVGQTAPGQGIQVRQKSNLGNAFDVQAGNVIIRHIKVRLGPTLQTSDIPNCFGIGAESTPVEDVILDHVSCAWATDQLMWTSGTAGRITVQWSLFYEGLSRSTHDAAEHSKGPNLRACGVTFANSLIAHNVIRNPNVTCEGQVNLVNNVIYNGRDAFVDIWNKRGDEWVNIIGNHIIRGPDTKAKNGAPYGVDAWDIAGRRVRSGTTAPQHLCLDDNLGEGMPGQPGSQSGLPSPIHGVLNPNDAHLVESTDCIQNAVGPLGIHTAPVPVAEVLDRVLDGAGALPWDRDGADYRVVLTVRNRSGAIIDHPNQVGGWPVMAKGASLADDDLDGMADSWEVDRGLDPAEPGDRNGDDDGDGYTNLEEYLNEIAGDQESQLPVPLIDHPPSAPGAPAADVACQVDLSWAEATDDVGVTKYRVYRDDMVIAQPTIAEYRDGGRPAGSYVYESSAVDPAGQEGPRSAAVKVSCG